MRQRMKFIREDREKSTLEVVGRANVAEGKGTPFTVSRDFDGDALDSVFAGIPLHNLIRKEQDEKKAWEEEVKRMPVYVAPVEHELQPVRNKMETEDFDYAIKNYSSGIKDPVFNRMRDEYLASSKELEEYIIERTVGEDDEDDEDDDDE